LIALEHDQVAKSTSFADRMILQQRPAKACAEALGSSHDMSWDTFVELHAQRESWQTQDETNSHLRERLEEFTDYELKDVDSTGHCQFDALADQVESDSALAVLLQEQGMNACSY